MTTTERRDAVAGISEWWHDDLVDDENVRRVMMLQLAGLDTDERIVALLGVDQAEVAGLRRAARAFAETNARAVAEQRLQDIRTSRVPKTDRELSVEEIKTLFDDPFWIAAEDFDPEDDDHDLGAFMVSYSDLVAHDLRASVEASVDEIRRFVGVANARHEDTELILVWGGDVDRDALLNHLEEWWKARLSQ